MGGGPSHQSNKVVIFPWWYSICAKITNSLWINFGGCIKSKTNLNMFISQITVNSFRATNYTTFWLIFDKILGQKTSISVWVISTDNSETVKIEGFNSLERCLELFWALNLVSAWSNHIKTSHVSVFVHVAWCDFHVLIWENTMWTS